jgi:hypothetical protein
MKELPDDIENGPLDFKFIGGDCKPSGVIV